MKTVSVIIPTYRNRGGLVRSIESVIKQNYEGLIQIIVVDDNNPGDLYRKQTNELVQQFSNNPKFVYLQHEHNKNGAAARNTGIGIANGDYIAFLDDDDIFLEEKLKKQVDYLDKNPDKSAVYCHAKRDKYSAPRYIIEGNGTREILELRSNFFTPSLMFRREVLLNLNGFDESFRRHQDYELLLRFFKAGYNIGCVPEILIEIGLNNSENSPSGDKLEKLKSYFFCKFNSYVMEEDKMTPGFANKVYARHYAGVFLSHIKHHYFRKAFNIFFHYFPKSPYSFMTVLYESMKSHLKV